MDMAVTLPIRTMRDTDCRMAYQGRWKGRQVGEQLYSRLMGLRGWRLDHLLPAFWD